CGFRPSLRDLGLMLRRLPRHKCLGYYQTSLRDEWHHDLRGKPLSNVACHLLLLAALTGCRGQTTPAARATAGAAPAATSAVRFPVVTQAAGTHLNHTTGRSGRLYLPETMGAGCAFLDYNNDGKLDLFLVNSSRLPGFPGKGPFYSALY